MNKKNLLKLPKQEDVSEISLGSTDIKIVRVTDENRPAILEAVTRTYMGDVCMYCLRDFTFDEVRKSIWAKPNPHGRIVHLECWNENNPQDVKS